MKKILLWVLMLVFTVSLVRAQESATQQQIDKLSGQIQDMLEAQAQQGKRLDALEKDVSELREKVNTPVATDSASRDDLKKLAEQVQDIDRKRSDDRDLILKKIEDLGKAVASTPPYRRQFARRTPRQNRRILTLTHRQCSREYGYEYPTQTRRHARPDCEGLPGQGCEGDEVANQGGKSENEPGRIDSGPKNLHSRRFGEVMPFKLIADKYCFSGQTCHVWGV